MRHQIQILESHRDAIIKSLENNPLDKQVEKELEQIENELNEIRQKQAQALLQQRAEPSIGCVSEEEILSDTTEFSSITKAFEQLSCTNHETLEEAGAASLIEPMNEHALFDCLSNLTHVEIPPTLSNRWATGHGINVVLTSLLKEKAHIIHPDSSSIYTPASSDIRKAVEGAVAYAKMIGGYRVGDELIGNGLRAADGTLTKPIVMIINTEDISVTSRQEANAEGGNHWQCCVVLPKHYTSLDGSQLHNDNEIIFYLDSYYSNVKLPEALRERLTAAEELKYAFESEGSLYEHVLPCLFPHATIIDSITTHQQFGGEDCGWWAVYNALLLVYTGKIDFLSQFTQPCREHAYKLRTLFRELTRQFHIASDEKRSVMKESEFLAVQEAIKQPLSGQKVEVRAGSKKVQDKETFKELKRQRKKDDSAVVPPQASTKGVTFINNQTGIINYAPAPEDKIGKLQFIGVTSERINIGSNTFNRAASGYEQDVQGGSSSSSSGGLLSSPPSPAVMSIRHSPIGTINNITNNYVSPSLPQKLTLDWEMLIACGKKNYLANDKIKNTFDEAQEIEACYVNLAIIEEKEQQKKTKKLASNEISRETWLNNYEALHGVKSSILPNDIFRGKANQELKRLLLLGRAGIGKSVFCQHAAYQWAKGGLWQETPFKLVIWVPLRQLTNKRFYPKDGKPITLGKVVYEQLKDYLSEHVDIGKEKQTIEALNTLMKSHRSDILYLLDGYDEVASFMTEKERNR